MKALDGWKTHIAAIVTAVILYATGDKATGIAQLGAILTEIWPAIVMSGMRILTKRTTEAR
jgi:hypothetical protein